MKPVRTLAIIFAFQLCTAAARAEEVIVLSGGNGLLNAPKSVAAAVVLIPGNDGNLGIASDGSINRQQRSPLVSTRKDYMARGVASLLIDANVSTSSAIEYLRRFRKPIVVVGLSKGSLRLAEGLSSQPGGIVIWSGFIEEVKNSIGSPSALPPTLVIHNRGDVCNKTPPDPVASFEAWGGSRVKVLWVGGGDATVEDPCRDLRAPHFMPGHEGQVVSAIASFSKSVR
jgi:hypothetical protein